MSAASHPTHPVFALAQRAPRLVLWGAASLVVSGCAFNDPPPVDLHDQTPPLPVHGDRRAPAPSGQATGGPVQANRYRPRLKAAAHAWWATW